MKKLLMIALLVYAGGASAQNLMDMLKKAAPQAHTDGKSTTETLTEAAPAVIGMMGKTTLDEERAMGRQLAGNLLGAVPLSKDMRLQAYVNKVGRWVAAQSDRPDIDWYFGVLESEDINAFALPGGYVFVTKGLYAMLQSEAELAGVLGHEIGHVVKQHHFKVLKQSRMIDVAGKLFKQQVASSGNGGLGNAAAQNLLGNGAEALARGLDKDAEYEADRIGVVLAARAGYEPYGLPMVLRKIARISPAEGNVALLFKTHPAPQTRLMRLVDAMGDKLEPFEDGKALGERLAAGAAKR